VSAALGYARTYEQVSTFVRFLRTYLHTLLSFTGLGLAVVFATEGAWVETGRAIGVAAIGAFVVVVVEVVVVVLMVVDVVGAAVAAGVGAATGAAVVEGGFSIGANTSGWAVVVVVVVAGSVVVVEVVAGGVAATAWTGTIWPNAISVVSASIRLSFSGVVLPTS
jgi:hypothetical protein